MIVPWENRCKIGRNTGRCSWSKAITLIILLKKATAGDGLADSNGNPGEDLCPALCRSCNEWQQLQPGILLWLTAPIKYSGDYCPVVTMPVPLP